MGEVLLTLDIDWAPDFVIDAVANILLEKGVAATWFVTHRSLAVERLSEQDRFFELGVHPNFLPGSSHGVQPLEVLRHVMELVPQARCVRTHALVQSTLLLDAILQNTPLEVDATVFLPGVEGIRPFRYFRGGRSLCRVPFFWEDDFAMEDEREDWNVAPTLSSSPGLKVFNFHPLHVYLNSSNMAGYQTVKANVSQLQHASPAVVNAAVQSGLGAGTLFRSLASLLSVAGKTRTLSALAAEWMSSHDSP